MQQSLEQYINNLDLDSMARWLCLIEGVNYIWDKLDDDDKNDDLLFGSKKRFNTLERALLKYVNQRFQAMKYDIQVDSEFFI